MISVNNKNGSLPPAHADLVNTWEQPDPSQKCSPYTCLSFKPKYYALYFLHFSLVILKMNLSQLSILSSYFYLQGGYCQKKLFGKNRVIACLLTL